MYKRKEWLRNFRDIPSQTIDTATACPNTNEMRLTAKGIGDVIKNSNWRQSDI